MINCHEITEFLPVLVTESGAQLYKAVLKGHPQNYWCKSSHKVNTHIGDAAFDNEQAAYRTAARVGIPHLPDAEIMEFSGQRWIVTPEARGKRLLDIQHDLSHEAGEFVEEEIFRLMSMLGREQGAFFGSLSQAGPRFKSERDLLERMLEMRTVPVDCRFQNLLPVLDRLEESGAFAVQPVLVHYDLWPGNIFYCSDSRTVTVIDLERCFYSDQCAEGASLLGMVDAAVLERRLCAGHPARIAKMYVYRILFLLERLDCCAENEEYRNIRVQLDAAMDTLSDKMRVLEG